MENLIKEIKEIKNLAVHGRLSRKVITQGEYDELMENIIDKCNLLIKLITKPEEAHK